MSDDPWGLERLRFEYINPDLLMKNPRVLKDSRFEYLIPELARADFKLPGEEEPKKEFGWAELKALLAGSRLSNAKNDEADTKGNEPMDEELFKRVEVSIEEFTRAAMEMQVAVIDAEARLKDAQQRWIDIEKTVFPVKQRLTDAEKTAKEARGRLNRHLDSVRGLNVTVPAPPGWGKNLGERNA